MRKPIVDNRTKKVYEIISLNIVRLRGKMTQEDLAKRAKTSRGTISAAEDGRGLNLQTLIKIAEALDVKPQDLFISNSDRQNVSYMHILLLEKLADSLNIKKNKKEGLK